MWSGAGDLYFLFASVGTVAFWSMVAIHIDEWYRKILKNRDKRKLETFKLRLNEKCDISKLSSWEFEYLWIWDYHSTVPYKGISHDIVNLIKRELK